MMNIVATEMNPNSFNHRESIQNIQHQPATKLKQLQSWMNLNEFIIMGLSAN